MPTRVSAAADLERELLTAEDFLEWLEPGTCADLIDGEIFMHSPVSIRHARLLNFLGHLWQSTWTGMDSARSFVKSLPFT